MSTTESETKFLTWTVRLYAQAPQRRLIVFLFTALAALAGLLLFHNLIYSVFAIVAILASTAEFWLPLRYKLTEKSAEVRCGFSVTAIEWVNVRRVIQSEEGWKLSPHRSEGRTSPFRGVYLRFGEEPEEVKDYVKSHITEDVRFVELGPDPGRGGSPPSQSGERDQAPEDGSPRDPGAGVP